MKGFGIVWIAVGLAGLLCAAGFLAVKFYPLSVLNLLTPSRGVNRVAQLSYGADARQRFDLYLPTHAGAATPVVIFVFGGRWQSGTLDNYRFAGEAYAARGFLTAVVSTRLYPAVKFPAFIEDVAQAVAQVQKTAASHGGDSRRLVLAGHSSGAYNALMVALDQNYLHRAGVDASAIKAVIGLSGPYDFLPFEDEDIKDIFSTVPPAHTQPIAFARAPAPPVFLATGLGDDVVKPKNTRKLAQALRSKQVRVEEHLYEGLDHGDTLIALAPLFQSKAPVLEESVRFLRSVFKK